MSAQEALADGIARAGIRHAFGVPGSGPTLELIDALERRGVRFTTTYFEGAAALMAGTMGNLSGKPGIALSIKGPGFANLSQGLAASWFENFPLVAFSEAYPGNVDWRVRHKGMDQGAMSSAVAKARVQVGGAGVDFAAIAAHALAEMPGPVVAEFVAGDSALPPEPAAVPADPRVASVVAAAQKPLVIAGTLAVRKGWGARLAALKIPVFSTASAKGVIDETLPHAAGVYTGVGLARAPEAALLPECDLIIGLGLRPGEVLATKLPKPAINVDTIPSASVFGFGATTSDSDGVFAQLARKEWEIPRIQLAVSKLRLQMQSGPFQPAHVYDTVDRHFRSQVRAVFDTGYFCTIGEHAWRARRPDWFLISGNGRFMGTGIPMAIGAAFHDATVPTVAFLGDGGIGTHVGELRIAARNRLPILFILMSDGGFGSVRTRAIKDGMTQHPLLMEDPSWLAITTAMGIPGARVENQQQFSDMLTSWQWRDGPGYIEVVFDPEIYQRMVDGLR